MPLTTGASLTHCMGRDRLLIFTLSTFGSQLRIGAPGAKPRRMIDHV
jgi:hypothetical protein